MLQGLVLVQASVTERWLDYCKYFLQSLEWPNIFCELRSHDRELYAALVDLGLNSGEKFLNFCIHSICLRCLMLAQQLFSLYLVLDLWLAFIPCPLNS